MAATFTASPRSRLFFGFRKNRETVSHVPAFREFFRTSGTRALIDCSEGVEFQFSFPKDALQFLDTPELWELLKAEGLVLVHDGNVRIRLERKEDLETRLSHPWQLLLDQRTLDLSEAFLKKSGPVLEGELGKQVREVSPLRAHVRLKPFADSNLVLAWINARLLKEHINLEAIVMSGYVILEYQERKSWDDSYFAI